MKRFQNWLFILSFALAGQACAAEGGAVSTDGPPANTAGQPDLKLTPGRAANIEGRVLVAGTGQPVPGVKLRWVVTNDLREPVLSGADGAFRLAGLAPGRAVITAIFPGEPVADWVAEDVLVTVAPGETRKDVLVRALRGGVAETTVLSRNDRKPLANVAVSATSQLSPTPICAVTGADGVARLRLLPDRWRISANRAGEERNGSQTEVTVVTGRTNQAEIEMEPSSTITGTVRDPDGLAVGEAVVSIGGIFASGREVRTDANGGYELTWWRVRWGGRP